MVLRRGEFVAKMFDGPWNRELYELAKDACNRIAHILTPVDPQSFGIFWSCIEFYDFFSKIIFLNVHFNFTVYIF